MKTTMFPAINHHIHTTTTHTMMIKTTTMLRSSTTTTRRPPTANTVVVVAASAKHKKKNKKQQHQGGGAPASTQPAPKPRQPHRPETSLYMAGVPGRDVVPRLWRAAWALEAADCAYDLEPGEAALATINAGAPYRQALLLAAAESGASKEHLLSLLLAAQRVAGYAAPLATPPEVPLPCLGLPFVNDLMAVAGAHELVAKMSAGELVALLLATADLAGPPEPNLRPPREILRASWLRVAFRRVGELKVRPKHAVALLAALKEWVRAETGEVNAFMVEDLDTEHRIGPRLRAALKAAAQARAKAKRGVDADALAAELCAEVDHMRFQ